MPQLMPMYWVASSIMFVVMVIMLVVVFGDFITCKFSLENGGHNNILSKWYW